METIEIALEIFDALQRLFAVGTAAWNLIEQARTTINNARAAGRDITPEELMQVRALRRSLIAELDAKTA